MIKWLRDLGHTLSGLFSLLHSLWAKVLDVKNKTLHIFDNLSQLVGNVEAIIRDIQNFEINPKWNSRVIVAPRVVERIKELYDVPMRIVTDVRDLVSLLKEKIEPAEVNTEDIEAIEKLPGKLVKAGEKIIGWATLIIDSLITIEQAIDDLNDITDAIRQSLEDLQNLDALFLPQGSTKKTVDVHYRKRNG